MNALAIALLVLLQAPASGEPAPAPPPEGLRLQGTLTFRIAGPGGPRFCSRPLDLGKDETASLCGNFTPSGSSCAFSGLEFLPQDILAASCAVSWEAVSALETRIALRCERAVGGAGAPVEKSEYAFDLPEDGAMRVPLWAVRSGEKAPKGLWGVEFEMKAVAVVPLSGPVKLDLVYERTGPEAAGPGEGAGRVSFETVAAPGRGKYRIALPPLPEKSLEVVPSLGGRISPRELPGGRLEIEVDIVQMLAWTTRDGSVRAVPGQPTGAERMECSNGIRKRVEIRRGETVRLDLPAFRDCGPGFERGWWEGARDRLYISWPKR